jgi:hypothetical protein
MPNPRYSAAPIRTSRELSGRVEQDFHQRGDPFRRRLWRWSIVACLAVVGWIVVESALGRRTIYEAGPVAPVHQFFENNCQACHTTWAPAARLNFVAGDAQHVYSVDDTSCQKCHAGSPHYEGQDPPHDNLGCAACHREHRGDSTLVRQANDQCIECHRALDDRLAKLVSVGDRPERVLPATSITSFFSDHPEFAALAQPDAAQIAFNHRAHLQHEYDKDGKLVKGILNERGELEDLSKDCTVCHQPDAEKRYMLPIKYSQHCQRCHPLYYDNEHFPGEVVPHGVATETLRGFLTERYTALALEDRALVEPAVRKRPLPGRGRDEQSLTPEGRRRVNEGAAGADERLVAPVADSQEAARDAALRGEQMLFGREALGGCRLCHVVTGSTAEQKGGTFASEWEIAKPNIPERWMARSRFSHDSHRFVSCTACHFQDSPSGPSRSVLESVDTSDVLMPSIAACRTCHADHATIPLAGVGRSSGGAASRCVDCHQYHHREGERLSGSVFFDLPGRHGTGNDGPALKDQ